MRDHAIIADFWVRVRVGRLGCIVITRSCCAQKAAVKAIHIVAKATGIRKEYEAFPDAIRVDLLIPDSARDRPLNLSEAEPLIELLTAQADQTTPN
jgi:hypothetical protein